jgi:hypothetical protein
VNLDHLWRNRAVWISKDSLIQPRLNLRDVDLLRMKANGQYLQPRDNVFKTTRSTQLIGKLMDNSKVVDGEFNTVFRHHL